MIKEVTKNEGQETRVKEIKVSASDFEEIEKNVDDLKATEEESKIPEEDLYIDNKLYKHNQIARIGHLLHLMKNHFSINIKNTEPKQDRRVYDAAYILEGIGFLKSNDKRVYTRTNIIQTCESCEYSVLTAMLSQKSFNILKMILPATKKDFRGQFPESQIRIINNIFAVFLHLGIIEEGLFVSQKKKSRLYHFKVTEKYFQLKGYDGLSYKCYVPQNDLR
jgi:hypothetical protein